MVSTCSTNERQEITSRGIVITTWVEQEVNEDKEKTRMEGTQRHGWKTNEDTCERRVTRPP